MMRLLLKYNNEPMLVAALVIAWDVEMEVAVVTLSDDLAWCVEVPIEDYRRVIDNQFTFMLDWSRFTARKYIGV
jgi:hypothetical protein